MLMAVALTVSAAGYKPADVPDVHAADRTQYVSNPDGLLSREAVARLNAELGRVRKSPPADGAGRPPRHEHPPRDRVHPDL